MNERDVCLADFATTHTILRDKIYFLDLTVTNANVSIISSATNLVEGSGRANIMLPNGTMSHPHPLLAAGVPATPQKSPAITSND